MKLQETKKGTPCATCGNDVLYSTDGSCVRCVPVRTESVLDLPKPVNDLRRKLGFKVGTAEEILASQSGVCAICEKPPGRKQLSADHCHETGRFRGFLCHRCNMALGLFADSPELLRKAAGYLKNNIWDI